MTVMDPGRKKSFSACTMDCPDACSILVETEGGVIKKLRGNPDHPITRGQLCPRPHVLRRMTVTRDRLLYPSLRVRGGRRRLSWSEALEIIAREISSAGAEKGSGLAILGSGSLGVTRYAVKHFFRLLGFRETYGSLCDEAGIEAFLLDTGELEMNDPREILRAGGIAIWGKTPSISSPHTAVLVREAVGKGTPLAVISPRKIPLSGSAFLDIRVRPGSDLYLAALVGRILLENGNYWKSAQRRSDNIDAYRDMVFRHSPDELSAAADVTINEARSLAEFLMSRTPISIIIGQGLQRHRQGCLTVRAINALAFLTGNIGRRGGGSYYNLPSGRNLNLVWMAPAAKDPLSLPLISRELSEGGQDIRMTWVGATNLVNQAPDSLKARKAFRELPFTVVSDTFWNDTAEASDLALPAALMFEKDDLVSSFGHDYLAYSPRVEKAPGEALSDFEIISHLAERLGIELPWTGLEDYFSMVLDSTHLRGGLSRLKKRGFMRAQRPWVAYRGNRFPRPGGKFNFLENLPSPKKRRPGDYPLFFLTVVQTGYQHSQIPTMEQRGALPVSVHPQTALKLGLSDRDNVYVKSPLGLMPAVLHLDDGLHPDVLLAPRGGWLKTGRGVNALVSARVSDQGHTAAFYSQKVTLLPYEEFPH